MSLPLRVCTKCGAAKPVGDGGEFYSRSRGYIEWRSACKSCEAEAAKKWSRANPEKKRATKRRAYKRNPAKELVRCRQWRNANPEKLLAMRRRHRTGWTQEMFNSAWVIQGGCCAICKVQLVKGGSGRQANSASADHCHHANKPRGLLCRLCNSGIGMLADSLDRLRSAVTYLEHHQ